MIQVKVTICKEEIIEIPEKVYQDLYLCPKSEEEHNRWLAAGKAVEEIVGMPFAYQGTGLRTIATLDGEILSEA
jgi:hypothetical protein